MPVITLPDGSQKHFSTSVSAHEVAAAIGSGLAKSALAAKVDQVLVDMSYVIEQDAELAIITASDPEGLEIIRHSTAHLLAQAVKLLYPDAQVTIGPVIENGFYYDFAYKRPFTTEDLTKIEQKMRALVKENYSVSRRVTPRNEAIAFFREIGEEYKAKIIEAIPSHETLSLYQQGDFIDLCRGPHVPAIGHLKYFKLMKVSGSYWRGDANNEMLQRIYGTAWGDKKSLKTYLHRLEEAEKRDHRKLAKQLDLFHLQEASPGMVFWHSKGWRIYQQIQDYLRNILCQNAYIEVSTPALVDKSLWEASGHWDKFSDMMFITHSEHKDFAVKPMNCPCHVQIFKQGLKSYRDLPLRMAEFGSCHRNEPSGTLHGLMRVRHFVQDDAHIFCTEEQIQSEVSAFIDLLFQVYQDFGFTDILIKLSTRPEKRVGSDALWDKAEQALELALNNKNLAWELQPGEGAFYGPKIEFALRDCLGRVWQCGTIQVDFALPQPDRLDATYIASDNRKKVPVMLHRAILGSLERFIGILIEHYAGIFPVWLAPIQVVVLSIAERHNDYCVEIQQQLQQAGFRVITDLRNEKIGFKIREHSLQKIPYFVIIGDVEMEQQNLTVRTRKAKNLANISYMEFINQLQQDIEQKKQV